MGALVPATKSTQLIDEVNALVDSLRKPGDLERRRLQREAESILPPRNTRATPMDFRAAAAVFAITNDRERVLNICRLATARFGDTEPIMLVELAVALSTVLEAGEGMRLLKRAADQGVRLAQLRLAQAYAQGGRFQQAQECANAFAAGHQGPIGEKEQRELRDIAIAARTAGTHHAGDDAIASLFTLQSEFGRARGFRRLGTIFSEEMDDDSRWMKFEWCLPGDWEEIVEVNSAWFRYMAEHDLPLIATRAVSAAFASAGDLHRVDTLRPA